MYEFPCLDGRDAADSWHQYQRTESTFCWRSSAYLLVQCNNCICTHYRTNTALRCVPLYRFHWFDCWNGMIQHTTKISIDTIWFSMTLCHQRIASFWDCWIISIDFVMSNSWVMLTSTSRSGNIELDERTSELLTEPINWALLVFNVT